MLARQYREQGRHCLCRCTLILTAEGHQYAHGTYSAVEAFHKTSAGGTLEASGKTQKILHGALAEFTAVSFLNSDIRMLDGTVGIQESTGEIGNDLAFPAHDHTRCFRNNSDSVRFQILFFSFSDELIGIFGSDDYGHTLLGFGDRKLGTVETFVFLADIVQFDLKTVSQFTDGNTDTAGTEIVAALDQACYFSVAEQSLDLSFLGSVTFLYFTGHRLEGFQVMCLG